VAGLHQPGIRELPVRAAALTAKAVQRGQSACRGNFEDRACIVCPALVGCSVEVPVAGLHESGKGKLTVRATALTAKAVQRVERASIARLVGDKLKDRSNSVGSPTIGCSVEVPVRALHQFIYGCLSVRAAALRTKAIQS